MDTISTVHTVLYSHDSPIDVVPEDDTRGQNSTPWRINDPPIGPLKDEIVQLETTRRCVGGDVQRGENLVPELAVNDTPAKKEENISSVSCMTLGNPAVR